MSNKINDTFDRFDCYLNSGDPEVRHRAQVWYTVINNRILSGEMVSPWFLDLAEKHILGRISMEEFTEQLSEYWSEIDYIMENGMSLPS